MLNICKTKLSFITITLTLPLITIAADPCQLINGKTDKGGIKHGQDLLVLLNREAPHQLMRKWNPDDLMLVPNGTTADKKNYTSSQTKRTEALREEALEKFMEMADAAKKLGLSLTIYSGFRDYEDQCGAYYGKIKERGDQAQKMGLPRAAGEDFAKKSSAPPGRSQHQLGTTFDMSFAQIPQFSLKMELSHEFKWLEQNAHQYGFVMSYPKAKFKTTQEQNKSIAQLIRPYFTKYATLSDDQFLAKMDTDPILKQAKQWYADYNPKSGYFYEPWHWRYVGVKAATDIKLKSLLPDDYYRENESQ